MQSSSINRMLQTDGPSKKEKKAGQAKPGDFDAALNEASRSDKKEDGKLLSNDTASSQRKKEAEKNASHAKKADRSNSSPQSDKNKVAAHHRSKTTNLQKYLQMLEKKNPSTLSTAEKQLLQVGEFMKDGQVNIAGLSSMLEKQGFPVSSLPPQQLETLANNLVQSLERGLAKQLEGGKPLRLEDNFMGLLSQPSNPKDVQEFQNLLQQSEQVLQSGQDPEVAAQRAQDRQNLLDSIIQRVSVQNYKAGTEMNLRLNPEYLGELKIQLFQSEKGGLSAKFSTTSRRTREILDASREDLTAQLESKGLSVSAMDVSLVESV